MTEKQGELSHMIERLRHLDAHTSIFLLRNCLWLPKLQYLLRAAPLYRQALLLENLDAVLQSALISISNVRLTGTSWQQAVLPTRYGGLGLRRLVDVALPSYVASLHLCLQVISSCLPSAMTSPQAPQLSAKKLLPTGKTQPRANVLPKETKRENKRPGIQCLPRNNKSRCFHNPTSLFAPGS